MLTGRRRLIRGRASSHPARRLQLQRRRKRNAAEQAELDRIIRELGVSRTGSTTRRPRRPNASLKSLAARCESSPSATAPRSRLGWRVGGSVQHRRKPRTPRFSVLPERHEVHWLYGTKAFVKGPLEQPRPQGNQERERLLHRGRRSLQQRRHIVVAFGDAVANRPKRNARGVGRDASLADRDTRAERLDRVAKLVCALKAMDLLAQRLPFVEVTLVALAPPRPGRGRFAAFR
jgi:hypothetical protein